MSYVLSEEIYGIVPFLQIHKDNVANPRSIREKSTEGFATSRPILFYVKPLSISAERFYATARNFSRARAYECHKGPRLCGSRAVHSH